MKQCPFCSESIQEAAVKCRYCREWLNVEAEPDKGNPRLIPAPSAAVGVEVAGTEKPPNWSRRDALQRLRKRTALFVMAILFSVLAYILFKQVEGSPFLSESQTAVPASRGGYRELKWGDSISDVKAKLRDIKNWGPGGRNSWAARGEVSHFLEVRYGVYVKNEVLEQLLPGDGDRLVSLEQHLYTTFQNSKLVAVEVEFEGPSVLPFLEKKYRVEGARFTTDRQCCAWDGDRELVVYCLEKRPMLEGQIYETIQAVTYIDPGFASPVLEALKPELEVTKRETLKRLD